MLKQAMITTIIWFVVLILATSSKGQTEEVKVSDNLLCLPTLDDLIQENISRIEAEMAIAKADEYREQLKAEKVKQELVTARANIKVSRSITKQVPNTDTSMKSYMSWTAITSKSSPQYKLQHSGKIHTDKNGFRRMGDKYCIAVGTFYGLTGDFLEVELENGTVFQAVIGDSKANQHTGSQNRQDKANGSVVEFIIDRHTLISSVKNSGNCSSLEGMEGNIKSIKLIEENINE